MKLDRVELGIIVVGIVACVGIIAYLVIRSREVPTTMENTTVSAPRLIPINNADNNLILREINNSINMQIPKGEVTDENVDVTGAITELYQQKEGFPWTSFSITNNGPDDVYVSVNTWRQPESPIPVGQTMSVDLKQRSSIKRVYLKCDQGNTTNVDIHAII